jgi:hypothetical protein
MRHDKPRFKGLSSAEGQIDVLTNKIINLGAPTAATDAARLQDVQAVGTGFYHYTLRESESGGGVWKTTGHTLDSAWFYIQTGGDGKPIVSLIPSAIIAGLNEAGSVLIEDPSARDYIVELSAGYSYTIESASYICSTGTATGAFYIRASGQGGRGVSVAGLDPLSISTTETAATATANKTVSVGGRVIFSVPTESSSEDINFTLKMKRA